jgi:AcrR family transcriptional regulator
MEPYTTSGTEYQIRELVYHPNMGTTPQPATAPPHAPPTLRNRATRAVRAEIAAVAMRLFVEQGFEKTTVDQIAAEAGLSRTSFFRYFATKEDVVLGHLEELGQRVLDALVARPAEEPSWQALRHAFDLLVEESAKLPEQGLSMRRLLHDTPSLKARQLGKQLGWLDLLVPEVARRLGVADAVPDARPRALVAAALGCLNAAVDVWTDSGGTVSLPALLDQAMTAVAG